MGRNQGKWDLMLNYDGKSLLFAELNFFLLHWGESLTFAEKEYFSLLLITHLMGRMRKKYIKE